MGHAGTSQREMVDQGAHHYEQRCDKAASKAHQVGHLYYQVVPDCYVSSDLEEPAADGIGDQ